MRRAREIPSFHWYEMTRMTRGGYFGALKKLRREGKKYNEFIPTYKKPIKKQRIKE